MSIRVRFGTTAQLVCIAVAFTGFAAVVVSSQPDLSRQLSNAPRGADVLALLPDGAEKRQLVLDCTGCHTLGMEQAFPAGRARTEQEWEAVVARMLGYAGATTRFPVIAERDAKATAAFLARHLTTPPAARTAIPDAFAADVREYLLPVRSPGIRARVARVRVRTGA
ncbi:MAG TPA: hypothetical protein VNP72_04985 [Longimicrobium sp.]|nr:hypothetical protein [Longimicrobium sp.]